MTRRDLLKYAGLTGGLLLVGCASPDATPASVPVAGVPRKGGQAVIYITHPQTLNPAITAISTDIYNTPFFYSGLTRPSDDYQPLPDLAESWTVSADSLVYTFKLRKDVKFHDGTPFTADDVKFTWELYSHPDNVPARQLAGFFARITGATDFTAGKAPEIVGLKVLDPLTLQVTLARIYAPFLMVSAGQMIMPKALWKDVAVKALGADPKSRKPVGTGPFVLDSWTANESIVAHAYEAYHLGRPNLDKLISLNVTDQATGFSQLKAGELDAMGLYAGVRIDNFEELKADPRLEARPLPGLANNYVEFNFRNPLLTDLRVRKALSYATDRKALRESLWRGQATTINSPIHPVFWASKADTTVFDGDLAKAKDLFAQAGWTPGADGILTNKEGTKFKLTMHTIQPDYPVVLQQQWKAAGVDLQIVTMDFSSFFGPLYLTGKTEAAGLNLPFGLYLDPDYPLGGYFSSALNRNKYVNPKVDEDIAAGTLTTDRERRKQIYYDLQEQLAQDVPHLWLGVPNEIWGINKKLVIPKKATGYLTLRAIKDWYRES